MTDVSSKAVIKSASGELGHVPDVSPYQFFFNENVHSFSKLLREEWARFFETGDIRYENFKYEALLKGLPKNGLRSLFWKIFLGYIPPDPTNWATILQPKRDAFTEMLESYLILMFVANQVKARSPPQAQNFIYQLTSFAYLFFSVEASGSLTKGSPSLHQKIQSSKFHVETSAFNVSHCDLMKIA